MLGRLVVSVAVLVLASTSGLAGAPQQQAAVPREVAAACDAAHAISAQTPGVSVERRTGTLIDETLPGPVFGCGLAIRGSFEQADATGDATIRLRQDFESRAWQEMGAYSADGTDGHRSRFARRGWRASYEADGTAGPWATPTSPLRIATKLR